MFFVLPLVPMKGSRGAVRISDGMQLWRLARRADWNVPIGAHCQLLHLVLPSGTALPAASANTAEILYQFGRRDRTTET